MDQLRASLRNSTFPPPMDFLLTVPRLAQRAGAFAFYYIPEQLDGLLKKAHGPGSIIAEPTASDTLNTTIITGGGTFIQETASAAATAAGRAADAADPSQSLLFVHWQFYASVFSYISSKWAIATVISVSYGWCVRRLSCVPC
jgi:hypothetical protein